MTQESNEKHENTASLIKALNSKIDHVHETLDKKIDHVHETLSEKIDAVAADLVAHRADTEAHHGVYRLKEGGN